MKNSRVKDNESRATLDSPRPLFPTSSTSDHVDRSISLASSEKRTNASVINRHTNVRLQLRPDPEVWPAGILEFSRDAMFYHGRV